MTTPPTIWAALVRAYRQQRGWTQQQMGERFSVSRWTVIRWESGEALPSVAIQEVIQMQAEEAA